MKAYKSKTRRGVLLLVILALLAMFAMVAVAFVVLTGRALTGAKQIQQIDQHLDQPDQDLERAAMQILRGTNNPASVVGPHSLLEDVYGQVPIPGLDDDRDGTIDEADEILWYENTIAAAPDLDLTVCGGQLFECTLPGGISRVGSVLTMRTGLAAGQSTRIVGYNFTNSKCQMLAFETGVPQAGDEYVINSTPFSGTGFGYDTTSGNLDATDAHTWERALLPNTAGFPTQPADTGYDASYPDPAGPGGANEDYDAVDFQNMLLGAQIPTGGTVATIPSLHRPALVGYWINHVGAATWNSTPALRRKVIMRPLHADHTADFANNNPSFDPVNGPWDVDNDGDGVADSVWVDLGMPARSTPDGRLYKPLFAILCLDMDGRLNLNAHGCLAQANPDLDGDATPDWDYYGAIQPTTEIPIPNPDATLAGDPATLPTMPRGQGCGPADINLRPLFADLTHYENILTGGTIGIDGRYGDLVGGGPIGAGGGNLNDYLSYNQHFDYPVNYTDFTTPTSYGTPPDMDGMMAVGLDLRGQPLYAMLNGMWTGIQGTGAAVDDPYELNLSQNTSRGLSSPSAAPDNPFSVAELERLLRPFDRDATRLPSRLYNLTYDGGINNSVLHEHRHEITTESWSLPCPGGGVMDVSGNRVLVQRITDLLAAKGATANWDDLLPPELLAGLRMDINRPFGNGRDEVGDTDSVVDNPGEAAAGETVTLYTTPTTTDIINVDHANDGPAPASADDLIARQIYARHLYVMMLLTMNYTTDDVVARQVAQWAVNIVDFRDRDSIMTPFEYDIKPFTDDDASATPPIPGTWDVDGDLNTNEHDTTPAVERGVVWGCERPELLITETLAFHDRRTEDLATPGGLVGVEDDDDKQFDQRKMPQGSLFIELYNPWNSHEPLPGEFAYDRKATTWRSGVRLNAVNSADKPVWRLLIADDSTPKDPDDPDASKHPNVVRSVYFAPIDPADDFGDTTADVRHYPNVPIDPTDTDHIETVIKPGQYAMIGPGEASSTSSTTYLGYLSTDADLDGTDSTRRIILAPTSNPDTAQVAVYSNGSANDLTGKPSAVAMIINHGISKGSPTAKTMRLSVSELTDGYPVYEGTGEYSPIRDDPIDETNPLWDAYLQHNDTYSWFRVVYLQRLANPLLPYDSETNPYRTIDFAQIDLTTFNGASSAHDIPINKIIPPQTIEKDNGVDFSSRERGEQDETVATPEQELWPPESLTTDAPNGAIRIPPSANNNFSAQLSNTLGYLNEGYGTPRTSPAGYEGDPQDPFPWLTWNNRPFVSQLELLMVPKWRSSQLLQQYGLAAAVANPYTNDTHPFPHMIPFFCNLPMPGMEPLCRLLDYLHVPSRFVGTELQANPVNCTTGDHSFHPPFNHISNYRDPGKVNINTIFSPDVWLGLINYFPDPSQTTTPNWQWDKFVKSRRGYGAGSTAITLLDQNYPTRFVRPFRSAAAGDLVPPISATPNLAPDNEIDATLLRPDPDPAHSNRPLFYHDSANPYDNTNRNPFFRYQGIQRLGNLVTTRSNVYAVWITVGYFEVSPAPINNPAIYPDGYALGAELGSDTGDINRHRAFYMFDRSVPVGFQRGKDLNVEKAVLLRRFIE